MNKLTKRILLGISLTLGLVLFGLVIAKTQGMAELFQNINYLYLVPFAVFSFSIYLVHCWRWKVIVDAHDLKFGYWKLVLFNLAGYAVSYVTPSASIGGEPVRAWLMQNRKTKFSTALSSVILDSYAKLTILILMGIIGFILLLLNVTLTENTFLVTLMTLIFSGLAVYYFYKRIANGKPALSLLFEPLKYKRLRKFKENLAHSEKTMTRFFKHKTRALLSAFSLSFLSYFMMFFEYFFLLKMLGYTATFMQIFMICAVIGIAYVMPVPAALGALELGQTSLFVFMAVNPAIGLGMSLIIRIRDCILSGTGFLYLLNKSFKFLGFWK